MKKILTIFILILFSLGTNGFSQENSQKHYKVGADDILEIEVLKPDEIKREVIVTPDGYISFPYVGTIKAQGFSVSEIQDKIQVSLANGYMNHPVVVVSLQESRSRKFFVYGEVVKPGEFQLSENTSVLKAISMAGGFTKFGSSSRMKLLRPNENTPGYTPMKIDVKGVMEGVAQADILLKPGDILVVSEGAF